MPLLFSYGTLQQDGVQLSIFGRLFEGRADALVGYAQSMVEVGNADVVARSGKTHHPIVAFTGNAEDRVSGRLQTPARPARLGPQRLGLRRRARCAQGGCLKMTNGESADRQANLAEAIIDSMADAVIFADRSGTIRRWNRAAAALFGFAADEALGQSLDLIVPEHLRAAHWRGFDAAMQNVALKLQGRPTLTRGQHKSGRKLYVEMTFALVTGEGAAQGAVAVARDVTERVLRERAASQKPTTSL